MLCLISVFCEYSLHEMSDYSTYWDMYFLQRIVPLMGNERAERPYN